MAYHTTAYLFVFLPIVLLAYQVAPKRYRWCVLLAAGYAVFWTISKGLLVDLLGTTVFVHYIGLWLDVTKQNGREEEAKKEPEEKAECRKRNKRRERGILAFGVLTLLAVLAYLKYYNFFVENVNQLLVLQGSRTLLATKKLMLPIGISFYTLQAIGYLADVYWNKIPAERHLGKVALFLGFFPQIMEGPIAMYSQTADALWAGASLRSEHLAQGCIRILWGLFKKLIIADRLYVLVEAVFGHYADYSGAMIIVAAVAYTVQLYMEFSGCMDMVIGSGQLFGITLPENFRRPFASRNAAEFWRRWHMTLGVWFKTYVFYPVSVSGLMKKWNRFGKKHCGKYLTRLGASAIALFPVWLCNGLWHGPQWNYIFYGMYYFVILLVETAVEPVWQKMADAGVLHRDAVGVRCLQVVRTWIIIFVGELFFRAENLQAGFAMFASIFRDFAVQKLWDGTLLGFGLDLADYVAVIAGCIVVGIVSGIQERKLLPEGGLQAMRLPVRWTIYYALIFAVIIFGAYGVGYQQVDLIYAGF